MLCATTLPSAWLVTVRSYHSFSAIPVCFRSEKEIQAISPREDSPAWLVNEIMRVKAGLMELVHNVVLLRDAENADAFFPVGVMCIHCSAGLWRLCACLVCTFRLLSLGCLAAAYVSGSV